MFSLAISIALRLCIVGCYGDSSASKILTVTIGEDRAINQMAVYPATGIARRPLLISAHGHGGSGVQEIAEWIDLAHENQFTIVCPTLLSSSEPIQLRNDQPYFDACLKWISNKLSYDRKNVYMTGMSGGGYATWYLATKRPDIFRGLFFQSCNFYGNYFDLDLSMWRDKPIKLIWGSDDLSDIIEENQRALLFLQKENCKNYTDEVIQGGHHEEHRDKVVSWIKAVSGDPSHK